MVMLEGDGAGSGSGGGVVEVELDCVAGGGEENREDEVDISSRHRLVIIREEPKTMGSKTSAGKLLNQTRDPMAWSRI